MNVSLDNEQLEQVRVTLQHALMELRVESARADTHDFRAMLHHREDLLEQVLAKLSEQNVVL